MEKNHANLHGIKKTALPALERSAAVVELLEDAEKQSGAVVSVFQAELDCRSVLRLLIRGTHIENHAFD